MAKDSKEIVRDYKDVKVDYAFDPSIFSAEPERVARVKWIIDHRLTEVEKTIILLYVDCQSYRKLARRLGISHTTVFTLVKQIKAKILNEYAKISD